MPSRSRSATIAVILCLVLSLVAGAAGAGAADAPPAREGDEGRLRITYPLDGALFPPEIVAPTFTWADATADPGAKWSVVVRDDEGDEIASVSVDEPRWRPPEATWAEIKRRSHERDAEVTVKAAGDRSARIHIRTSKDEVGDALFYREVPLPFIEAVRDPSRIRWRFGTIDMVDGPPIVLKDLPVCGNCHSFADDGSVLGLDVDYGNDKGGYGLMPVSSHMVMNDDSIITWADYERDDGEVTFGLLSRVSPTGRYVISTVKDRSVFVAMPDLMISQLFFPIKGILVVYDRETGEFFSLPGADDPDYVQTNPVWSPDGQEIVFARTKAYRSERLEQQNSALLDEKDVPEFTVDGKPFRYDLYRIPWNDGKGGEATPLVGASDNEMSNYFPKYSPDGKWIVYTRSDNYMLLRPDSELYIVPAAGGEARRLQHNTPRMNSWHSWSSNSRWLVFSSKANGPYTQLWLTHIDEDGNDTPPVLLERFTAPDRAANIPEFVNLRGDAIAEIREEFLDPYSFLRAGTANQRTGDLAGAQRLFRRGLELAPGDAELHNALGWSLFQDGKPGDAVVEYKRALEADPEHAKAHNNLALALVELGRLQDAAGHFSSSLELAPRAEIYSDLGFTQARMGMHDRAEANYRRALELDPNCASAHFNLAVELVRNGALKEAEAHYRKAVPLRPTAEVHNGLGFALDLQKRTDEALAEFHRALELDPDYVPALNNLASTLARQGKLDEAASYYQRSLAAKPNTAAYYALGGLYRTMGRNDDADAQYEKARALAAARASPPPSRTVKQ